RYQSMTELIADLERCLAECLTPAADKARAGSSLEIKTAVTVISGPSRKANPADSARGRNLTWMGAALVGVVLLIGGVIFFANRGAKPVGKVKPPDSVTAPKPKPAPEKPTPPAAIEQPAPSETASRLAFQKPGFEQWVNETSAKPFERQLEAVS